MTFTNGDWARGPFSNNCKPLLLLGEIVCLSQEKNPILKLLLDLEILASKNSDSFAWTMSDPLVMCLKKMESGLDWICFNGYGLNNVFCTLFVP